MLLQAFFSIRSERMLMEQINHNLPFRWFAGLSMDADVWHPTGFTHNRKRIEVCGWIKAQAGFAKLKARGRPKVAAVFGFVIAAYNLVTLSKLIAEAAG